MTREEQPAAYTQSIQAGLAHMQAGRLREAEASFRRALDLNADEAEAYKHLGVALAGQGHWDAALSNFLKALQIDPDYADGHISVGNVFVAQGRHKDAVACYHKALKLNPDSAKAHSNLGIALQSLGKLEEAAACYRKALELDPGFTDAYNNLGRTLYDLGKPDEAVSCFAKATELNPKFVDAHNNLGVVLQRLGKLDEALVCYRSALELNPDYAKAHGNMGTLLNALGNPTEALVSYRRALELAPQNAEVLLNMGNALQALGRSEEAVAAYHKALSFQPGNSQIHTNLGIALQSQIRLDEALASHYKALQFKPNSANAQWNLGIALLLRGDLAAGLVLYEQRFEGTDRSNAEALTKFSGIPRWQGGALQGKTLLLWNEQGLGDGIMMLRYLPLLKERGAARILVYCQPALAGLVQTFPAVSRVIDDATPMPQDAIDFHCPLMSLPYLFGTRLETIPDAVPYIKVSPAMTAKWQRRLAAVAGFKVGLVWAGSKAQKRDFLRSIAPQRMAPLLAVSGARFISLQRGVEAGQAAAANAPLIDWMEECPDFTAAAALVQQLDLVISVDTAVAHLAGALGKPVWLLNRFESEWRWMLTREDSPWYPTMRIFRQPAPNDWDSVIKRVAEELRRLVPGPGEN